MNTHRQTRLQALLERISFGAMPVDGIYWVDPKDVRLAQARIASLRGQATPQNEGAAAADADRSSVSFSWLRPLWRS
jgi:hypothetical protein